MIWYVYIYIYQQLLDKIFDEFASFWMNMKVEVKTKEDHEAQEYKFKPRAFKLDNIIEVDISALGSSVSKESFSEWQEFLSEEESTDGVSTFHICLDIFVPVFEFYSW